MSTAPLHHLLIPFAACSAEAWRATARVLPRESTRNLTQLLRGMKREPTDAGDARTLSPPHERALARALGLTAAETRDGLIPLAALDAAVPLQAGAGLAWAWITPCHWSMGSDRATLIDPAALALQEDDSRALLAAMQPYFETDGITLHYLAPERWLAEGEPFRELPTASLDRVLGSTVDAWLPDSRSARPLRRLQNEMQMLLYTHPLNDARAARRQLPVNSFWISGTGALPARRIADALAQRQREQVSMPRSLAESIFSNDWNAYTQAWAALDAGEVAQLLALQRAGKTVRLTLCGDRNALTLETSRPGLIAKISSILAPEPLQNMLEQL